MRIISEWKEYDEEIKLIKDRIERELAASARGEAKKMSSDEEKPSKNKNDDHSEL